MAKTDGEDQLAAAQILPIELDWTKPRRRSVFWWSGLSLQKDTVSPLRISQGYSIRCPARYSLLHDWSQAASGLRFPSGRLLQGGRELTSVVLLFEYVGLLLAQ